MLIESLLSLCLHNTSAYVGAWSYHEDRKFVVEDENGVAKLHNQDHDRVGILCHNEKEHFQVSKFENSFFNTAVAATYGKVFYSYGNFNFFWDVGLVGGYSIEQNFVSPLFAGVGIRYPTKVVDLEVELIGNALSASVAIRLW